MSEGYYHAGVYGDGWRKSDKFTIHLTARFDSDESEETDIFDIVDVIVTRNPTEDEDGDA